MITLTKLDYENISVALRAKIKHYIYHRDEELHQQLKVGWGELIAESNESLAKIDSLLGAARRAEEVAKSK